MEKIAQHWMILSALLACAGCATPYVYSFHNLDQAVLEDADVEANVVVDPTGQQAVLIDLINKTDQVLQVEWTKISMLRPDGGATALHPDIDLGWIASGAKQSARLIPFALPNSGNAALAQNGQDFQLEVPMIVRREPKVYRYRFVAAVQKAESR